MRYWRTRPSRRSSGTGSRSVPGSSSSRGVLARSSVRRVAPVAGGLAARCCSSHATAVRKSTPARCITRSIAPPPPWPRCQFVNLGPVTDSGPCSVCHLAPVVPIAHRAAAAATRSPAAPRGPRRHAGGTRRSSFPVAFSVLVQLGPQAVAVLHVDHMAGFRQPIEQGAGQVVVLQERCPTR